MNQNTVWMSKAAQEAARSLAVRYRMFHEAVRTGEDKRLAAEMLLEAQDKTGVELMPRWVLTDLMLTLTD